MHINRMFTPVSFGSKPTGTKAGPPLRTFQELAEGGHCWDATINWKDPNREQVPSKLLPQGYASSENSKSTDN